MKSVLVIDDNDVTRALLRHILSESKYKVVGQTGNGELGIRMIEKLRPDIVCLDVIMDELDGIEVLRKIKERWPEIAVLMVTGCKDTQTVLGAMNHGADGYILKPFNPGALIDAIKSAVAKLAKSNTPSSV